MKKQYFKPTLKAYNVNSANIIATSSTLNKGTGTQPGAADGKDGWFEDEEW